VVHYIDRQIDRMYKITKIYDINALIERFTTKYREINGSNTNNSKTVIKALNCHTLNKKTFIKNYTEVCESINRHPDDVLKFINSELQVQSSISNDGCLGISGMYKKHQLENIIKKYVISFVQCPSCRTQNTTIEKKDRVRFLRCNKCRASVSLS
jgi:translation initiation factor 2 subunit 2